MVWGQLLCSKVGYVQNPVAYDYNKAVIEGGRDIKERH